MVRQYRFLFSILVSLVALTSCGLPQMEVIEDIEETFEGVEEIYVKGGSLEVSYEGSDRSENVFLNAYLQGSKNSGMEITYRIEDNKLWVEVLRENSAGWGNIRSKGFISLIGPENIRLELISSSGTISVSNVISDKIDLNINSGKIDAKYLSSNRVNVGATSGQIDLQEVNGEINCQLSSGKGNLSNIQGDVYLTASSGAFQISEVEGTVNGSLNSGKIIIKNALELGQLKISSGSISASESGLGAQTNFSGSSGSFDIQTFSDLGDYNFDLSSSSGSLEVGSSKERKVLKIDNGSETTISGSISSGRISIRN